MRRRRRSFRQAVKGYFKWPRLILYALPAAFFIVTAVVVHLALTGRPEDAQWVVRWTPLLLVSLVGGTFLLLIGYAVWALLNRKKLSRDMMRRLVDHAQNPKRRDAVQRQCERDALAAGRGETTAGYAARVIGERLDLPPDSARQLLRPLRQCACLVEGARRLYLTGTSRKDVTRRLRVGLRQTARAVRGRRARRALKRIGSAGDLAERALAAEMRRIWEENAGMLAGDSHPSEKLAALRDYGVPEVLARRVLFAGWALDGRMDLYESAARLAMLLSVHWGPRLYRATMRLVSNEAFDEHKAAIVRSLGWWKPDGNEAISMQMAVLPLFPQSGRVQAAVAHLEACGRTNEEARRRLRWWWIPFLLLGACVVCLLGGVMLAINGVDDMRALPDWNDAVEAVGFVMFAAGMGSVMAFVGVVMAVGIPWCAVQATREKMRWWLGEEGIRHRRLGREMLEGLAGVG